MKKTQKESNQACPALDGQISLDDVLAGADDGTYGKPADEYEVHDE